MRRSTMTRMLPIAISPSMEALPFTSNRQDMCHLRLTRDTFLLPCILCERAMSSRNGYQPPNPATEAKPAEVGYRPPLFPGSAELAEVAPEPVTEEAKKESVGIGTVSEIGRGRSPSVAADDGQRVAQSPGAGDAVGTGATHRDGGGAQHQGSLHRANREGPSRSLLADGGIALPRLPRPRRPLVRSSSRLQQAIRTQRREVPPRCRYDLLR